jgi:RHS repeat-associated protein
VVTSNGVTNVVDTVYDAGMPVEEVGYAQGTNTPYVSAVYLRGPRRPEYRRDVVHQSVAWYVYDGLGSIVEEVDPSGNITASRKYDVYGLVRSGQSGSSSQKYVGSLGHESDTNTGLIYMRARYMDPVLGRFLSEDPSKDGANWFVYCGDEPVNHVDPNGKIEWEQFAAAIIALIGFAMMYAAGFELSLTLVIGLVLLVGALGWLAYDAFHTKDEVGKAGTNQVNKYVDKIKPWLNPDTNLITLEPIVDEIVTKLKTSGSVWLAIAGWDLELTFACLDTDAP